MKHPNFSMSMIAAACAALVLAACGGGGGSTASNSSGTATTSGTVTGFGSVIVDGVRIDNRAVVAGIENEDDSVQNAEIKIGQHVDVEHDDKLVAKSIRITSELEGTVEKLDTVAATLTVLGETVAINSDPAAGPVTVFEMPYQKLADIKVGDAIEIYGLIKTDASGKITLQATRIEKKTSANFNRIKGNVSALSTTNSTFKVGDLLINYAGAKVKPSVAALVNGAEVYVSIPVNPTLTGPATNAAVIKIKDRKEKSQEKEAKLGGAVSKLDTTAKTFLVDGIKIDASQAEFEQSGKNFASLKEGMYVRVKGTYLADGTLKAKTIVLRASERKSGQEIELHGSILNYKSISDFMLRDLNIDASKATISCAAATLKDNMQVEVEGSLTAGGKVMADEVKCEQAEDGQSVIERIGVVSKIDMAAKTLVVGTLAGAVTVQWSADTLFVSGVDLTTLDGKRVEIEGVMVGGVFQVYKIKLQP